MAQALVTAVFLVALWSLAKVVVDLLAEDGAKIRAALMGDSMAANPPASAMTVSVRYQPRAGSVRRPVHATPEWRDAA